MKKLLSALLFIVVSAWAVEKSIVLTESLRLRSSPEIVEDNVIGSVNLSDELEILEEKELPQGIWLKIKTVYGLEGWVDKAYIGLKGESKLKRYCKRILNDVFVQNFPNITEQQIYSKIKTEETSKRIINFGKTQKIPLSFLGHLLLLQKDKRGVEILIESLKLPEGEKYNISHALQALAMEDVLENNYEAFKAWYERKKTQLNVDDFTVIRACNTLRQ